MGLGLLRGTGRGLILATLILLVVAWIDLLIETPAGARQMALWIAALTGALELIGSVWKAGAGAMSRRLASLLDRVGGTGGIVLTGVDLAETVSGQAPSSRSPMSEGLARLAKALALETARRVSLPEALPAWPSLEPYRRLLCLVALVATASRCAPGPAITQYLRMTDPGGDHPPYSPTHFTVFPGAIRVQYGSTLDVTVRCEGLLPESLELIVTGVPAGDTETLPMFREDAGRWRTQIQDIRSALTYFVRSPHGRSHRNRIDVITVPRILAVTARVIPPAHTGTSAREGPLIASGFQALPGTLLEVTARSNRPLSGGHLELKPSRAGVRRIPVTPLGPGSPMVRGRFSLEEPGVLTFRVIDTDGVPSRDTFQAPLSLLADEYPTIRLVEPLPESVATPSARIPVVLEADDDYGISRLQLYRSLNRSRDLAREVPLPEPPGRAVRQIVLLDLGRYGLEPGDVIELFARVCDNQPGRFKGVETPVVHVTIISRAEFDAMNRRRHTLQEALSKYRHASRLLENLIPDLERLRRELRDARTRGEEERLRQALLKLSWLSGPLERSLRELRRSLQEPAYLDIDAALRDHLQKAVDALTRSVSVMEEATRTPPATVSLRLEELLEDLTGLRAAYLTEVSQPLDLLEAVYSLLADEDRFVRLALSQRDLARRSASLSTEGRDEDPAARSRMRDLAIEQQRIRVSLDDLLEDIRRHALELPGEGPYVALREEALTFATAVGKSSITETMRQAESGFEQGESSRGTRAAAQAADQMQRFLGACQKTSGGLSTALHFHPTLCKRLGKTLDQLLGPPGLGPGPGLGAGGGYSMFDPQSRLGLYGESSSTSLTGTDEGEPVGSSYQREKARLSPVLIEGKPSEREERTTFGGVPAGELPPIYRERIRAYFQRLAEDTPGSTR